MEADYGMLTSADVARLIGSEKSGRSLAADQHSAGKLIGIKRGNRYVYPGLQFGQRARKVQLLEPEPQLRGSAVPDPIARAYNAAYRLAFDDARKSSCDHEVLAAVARRRSGRPLGFAA